MSCEGRGERRERGEGRGERGEGRGEREEKGEGSGEKGVRGKKEGGRNGLECNSLKPQHTYTYMYNVLPKTTLYLYVHYMYRSLPAAE